METIGGDGSEAGLMMKKKGKIDASLAPDYRDKEESNNNKRKMDECPDGRSWDAVQPNGKNNKNPDDVGRRRTDYEEEGCMKVGG